MIDVFEVDRDSFCTVLELCTGDDLDARLKAHGPVPERGRARFSRRCSRARVPQPGPKKIITTI